LRDSTVYLLREDDDLVLADRCLPVLTLEDESRLVSLRNPYRYENVDFVVDIATLIRFRRSIRKGYPRRDGDDSRMADSIASTAISSSRHF
jgi:hypothetical protein